MWRGFIGEKLRSIAGSLSRKLANGRSQLLGLFFGRGMTAVFQNEESRGRQRLGQTLLLRERNDLILPTGHHQRRRFDLRQAKAGRLSLSPRGRESKVSLGQTFDQQRPPIRFRHFRRQHFLPIISPAERGSKTPRRRQKPAAHRITRPPPRRESQPERRIAKLSDGADQYSRSTRRGSVCASRSASVPP